MTTSPDCEHGFHGVLVAHAPIESGDTVEIDFVCTACGSVEYTHYYAREDWQRELAQRTATTTQGHVNQPPLGKDVR